MKEQLITFETAKLAKEKGFNEQCIECYTDKKELYSNNSEKILFTNNQLLVTFYSAPTQSLLQKWLREEHNLFVAVNFGYKFEWEVRDCRPKKLGDLVGLYPWNVDACLNDGLCDNYEQALEEGLKEALKLIQ